MNSIGHSIEVTHFSGATPKRIQSPPSMQQEINESINALESIIEEAADQQIIAKEIKEPPSSNHNPKVNSNVVLSPISLGLDFDLVIHSSPTKYFEKVRFKRRKEEKEEEQEELDFKLFFFF